MRMIFSVLYAWINIESTIACKLLLCCIQISHGGGLPPTDEPTDCSTERFLRSPDQLLIGSLPWSFKCIYFAGDSPSRNLDSYGTSSQPCQGCCRGFHDAHRGKAFWLVGHRRRQDKCGYAHYNEDVQLLPCWTLVSVWTDRPFTPGWCTHWFLKHLQLAVLT